MSRSQDGRCPTCHSDEVDVLEYDADDDFYVYRCNGCLDDFTFVDDSETWK